MTIALLSAALLMQGAAKVQIKDTTVGTGRPVVEGDLVTVDYTGKLTTGKQFDSSVGKPTFTFRVGSSPVIRGWHEGLPGMKVGGSRHLTIPSELGYGARGAGGVIPPNANLEFDIKLYRIERRGDKPTIKINTLKKGKGPAAKKGDTVSLHYTGRFLNGTKFDSSLDRKQPFPVTIGVTSLIPGFTQGVIGIKAGEKRKVIIPSQLAYGANGFPPDIPENAPIVFELEALKVTPKK